MGPLEFLRLVAAALTIVAAILVAANWSPRITVAGVSMAAARLNAVPASRRHACT
jgi:hypothetical protein